jgi:hypothetical protein
MRISTGISMLSLIPEEPITQHNAVLIAHLDGEVSARIDGVGFTV